MMSSEQIQLLVDQGLFPGPATPVEWVETHISWVILTPKYAFKIKKPVRFPFLDFSSAEKRKFYCQEELRLNRRLAPDMYLGVLPLWQAGNGALEISEAEREGTPIDYAIWMKRQDNLWQMDVLLRQNAVRATDMSDMAQLLVRFHRSVVIPGSIAPYRPGDNRADFEDLFRLKSVCQAIFGARALTTLEGWRQKVAVFLDRHEARLHERALKGFWVDGHGDLHARNIFLLPEGPVVFDCIEFNPHFRQLDILNELAFLCMDLDAGDHHELAETFMEKYGQLWRCIECPEDEQLFLYFKAYRANVRLKVALQELEQHRKAELEATARRYWDLLGRYLEQLV